LVTDHDMGWTAMVRKVSISSILGAWLDTCSFDFALICGLSLIFKVAGQDHPKLWKARNKYRELVVLQAVEICTIRGVAGLVFEVN